MLLLKASNPHSSLQQLLLPVAVVWTLLLPPRITTSPCANTCPPMLLASPAVAKSEALTPEVLGATSGGWGGARELGLEVQRRQRGRQGGRQGGGRGEAEGAVDEGVREGEEDTGDGGEVGGRMGLGEGRGEEGGIEGAAGVEGMGEERGEVEAGAGVTRGGGDACGGDEVESWRGGDRDAGAWEEAKPACAWEGGCWLGGGWLNGDWLDVNGGWGCDDGGTTAGVGNGDGGCDESDVCDWDCDDVTADDGGIGGGIGGGIDGTGEGGGIDGNGVDVGADFEKRGCSGGEQADVVGGGGLR
ncbi:unnamed protein product [Closterium sp. NIES-64]|nr:unnamed protein product [Closterium sp. NIES-64]